MLNGLLQHTFVIQVYVAKHPLLYCISMLLNSSVPISMGWNVTVINLWPIWPFCSYWEGRSLWSPQLLKIQTCKKCILVFQFCYYLFAAEWKNEYVCWSIIPAALLCVSVPAVLLQEVGWAGLNCCHSFFINSNDIFLIRMCRKSCKGVLKINLP